MSSRGVVREIQENPELATNLKINKKSLDPADYAAGRQTFLDTTGCAGGRQAFHEQLSINNILNTLEISANKTQTIIQKIEKYNYKPNSLWDSYQIDLTVAGQYQYIVNFINMIARHYNFITFEELDLQKITTSPLEDEFTLNIIFTISSSKILNPIQKNNDLISQPKTYPKNNDNLYLWSMQELQFVGSIKQHNKIIGFVTDPMGETHQITIGDRIGLKQEIITNINETGITTNAQKIKHSPANK